MELGRVQQAAVACFAQRGFAATGIRELGSAVGLNSATLYHYVGGKEDLLLGIMNDCLSVMISGAKQALDGSTDPVRQLALLIAFHVGFTATNPSTARVTEHEMRALSPSAREQMQALRDEYEQLFSDALKAGERQGSFNTADLGIARLALMEMGTGVSHWYRKGGRLSLAEVQLNFISLAMRILAVPDEFPLPPQQLPVPQVIASEPTLKD
ncbi:TetR/AcrR family transcriptional regulator [Glutamicibacter nicotianae]|uniref:TetR/AcrR family transcriptional regulator n=1 Tax=Glutamicibacter nicotianae TaxID=37929 RepID=UPI00195B313C|nr:TetR/AcrR family transcriptional regulator [Glutamicibacter nicotianae]MBM7766686.1 AcrR family transcriptional regulator [Glutamicibacter nicotianae]